MATKSKLTKKSASAKTKSTPAAAKKKAAVKKKTAAKAKRKAVSAQKAPVKKAKAKVKKTVVKPSATKKGKSSVAKKSVTKTPAAKKPAAKKPTAKKKPAAKSVGKKQTTAKSKKTSANKTSAPEKKEVKEKVAKLKKSRPKTARPKSAKEIQQAVKRLDQAMQDQPDFFEVKDDTALVEGSTQTITGDIDFMPYQLKKNEEYMNDQQIEHFRTILLTWKSTLMQVVDSTVVHLQQERNDHADPLDRAVQEEGFNLELRTRDRERQLLKKIEQAIDWIEEGVYGYCEDCGAEIGIRRLEARPTAAKCIDCKTYAEMREKQVGG